MPFNAVTVADAQYFDGEASANLKIALSLPFAKGG
jgi:hypothetical protein